MGTFLRHNLVHLIASDANDAKIRPPLLKQAVERVKKIIAQAKGVQYTVPKDSFWSTAWGHSCWSGESSCGGGYSTYGNRKYENSAIYPIEAESTLSKPHYCKLCQGWFQESEAMKTAIGLVCPLCGQEIVVPHIAEAHGCHVRGGTPGYY